MTTHWLVATLLFFIVSQDDPEKPLRNMPPADTTDPGEPAVASTSVIPPKRVKELIAALSSDEFGVRRQASRELIDAGHSVLPELTKAAQHGALERAIRIIGILEANYVSGDTESVRAADEALETLSGRLKQPARAARARTILEAHGDIRFEQTIARIREYGAELINEKAWQAPTGRVPNQIFPQAASRELPRVHIDEAWTGGTDGLRWVKRLKSTVFRIYIISDAKLPEQAVQELMEHMGANQVQLRGTAHLGVSARPGLRCRISTVTEGDAADRAGMQEDDVIVRFAGEEVRDFEDLITLIKKHDAGDEVDVDILRDEQPMTLRVKLGRWRRPKQPPR